MSSLSDIDADPVIDNGQVFAIGEGGRMVALDLVSGQRMWELGISGISTPWVAGDWVYVGHRSGQATLYLPAERSHPLDRPAAGVCEREEEKGDVDYSGPVLAGGRLIVTGSNGAVIQIDPATGTSKRS